jgi:hypothetical protein
MTAHRFGRWFRPLSMALALAVGIALGGTGSASAAGSVLAANDRTVEVVYRFDPPVITRSGAADQVHIPGLNSRQVPGEPELPEQPVRILVPNGQQVKSFQVIPGRKVLLSGTYRVEPAQMPLPLSLPRPPQKTAEKPEIYQKNAAYPGRTSEAPAAQAKRAFEVVQTTLYPVEYLPKSGKLYYYPEMRVAVDFEPAFHRLSSVRRVTAADKAQLRAMVDNPASADSYAESPAEAPPRLAASLLPEPLATYPYVIITNQQLSTSDFTKLVLHKQSQGTSAKIVTTEWITATYSGQRPSGGADDQTRIRNFIIDAHNTWGTEYVLLGGTNAIVPARKLRAQVGGYVEDIPSDLYYSCLDGTFDHDADGIYGEPNDGIGGQEVDLYAEVYVGRAAVENATEAANFVAKTIAYDTSTDPYLHLAGMVGEHLGFSGVSEYATGSMEEIRLGASSYGYTTMGFENSPYSGFFVTHHNQDPSITDFPPPLYDAPNNLWSKSTLINWINNGRGIYKGLHIINHLGHANITYAMKMTTADLPGLTNTRPVFIYSQGCLPGAFDSPNCFAEQITSMKYGAFAAVMNARYGWGALNSNDGGSQRFNRAFWHGVFAMGKRELGKANAFSKEHFNASRINQVPMRWCYYETNLFGDPQLKLKVEAGSGGGGSDPGSDPGDGDDGPVEIDYVSTGKPYALGTAEKNAKPYIDAPVAITGISPGLKNGILVQTAAADKNVAVPRHLELTFNEAAVVYVALDQRAAKLPTWLATGWIAAPTQAITTSEAAAGPMKIYKKIVPAKSALVLGGNQQGGPTGAQSNYFVVVMPPVEIVSVSSGKPYTLAKAEKNALPYIDRTYVINAIGPQLDGGVLVQTANLDRYMTNSNHLVLNLHKAATVFIALDGRTAVLPLFMRTGWTPVSETISTTYVTASPMKIYKKQVPAGAQLSLGANYEGGNTGGYAMYFVVVKH